MEVQDQIDVYIFIGILILTCISMLAAIVFMLYGRKLLEREVKFQLEIFKKITETEERQKEKIARNLHDEIIPVLSVIEQSMDMNNKEFKSGKFDHERAIRDVEALEKIRKDIRGISHDLVPSSLFSLGLFGALEYHFTKPAPGSNVDFKTQVNLQENVPFNLQEQTNIYRICLEIFNNLKKHSLYEYLKVNCEIENHCLTIDFIHDGHGITNDEIGALTERSTGIGLKSIQARALLLKATIDYTFDSHNASVTLKIPVKK